MFPNSRIGYDGDVMTPELFGGRIRVLDRGDARAILPPMSRIVDPPRGPDCYELRLGMDISQKYRYAYGYIGPITRLETRSANTNTSFLRHVVEKIVWVGDSLPYSEYRCAFARVLAYSADFADTFRGSETIVSLRDFAQGTITSPHSSEHTGANFHFWRFANMVEFLDSPAP